MPPPLPKSPPPIDSANPQLRLDRLLNGNASDGGDAKFPSALRNGDVNIAVVPVQKKVSWNDAPESTTPTSDEPGDAFTLQDIDEVLGTPAEPENIVNFALDNTPNVIGAQEVYRDPRERIKQERLLRNQQFVQKPQGPEKLSFKEKMKMFAMEAGQESLRDKNKHSKAQREIDGEEQTRDGQDEFIES